MKKTHLMTAIIVLMIAAGSTARSAQLEDVSARDAVKAARAKTAIGPELDVWYEKRADDLGKSFYVVDFVSCDKNDSVCFFRKRVLVDPKTGQVEEQLPVLKEWYAADGQVPPEFDAYTKAEKQRPEKGRMVTSREAVMSAVSAARMDDSYQRRIKLLQDQYGTAWYAVDFVKPNKAQNTEWHGRVVVNPYTGEAVSDRETTEELGAAEGSRPKDLMFVGNSKQIMTPDEFAKFVFMVRSMGLFILLHIILFFTRKRRRQWTAGDHIAFWGMLIVFWLSFMIGSLVPSRMDVAASTFVFGVFILVQWLTVMDYKRLMGIGTNEDIKIAKPSTLIKYDSVGGMEQVKAQLRETVGILIRRKESSKKMRVDFNGVLLYGPAGTGKTFIAQATAGEFGLNFIRVKVSDMTSPYFGGSAKMIDGMFKQASKNRPCLVFLDEIDSLGASRSTGSPHMEDKRIVNHLLHWLEEIRDKHPGVYIFAATNRKEDLDEALIRPGRFDRQIYIPLPDQAARVAILQACLKDRQKDAALDLNDIALRLDGMSAAAIDVIINKAALNLISRHQESQSGLTITPADVYKAVNEFRLKRKDTLRPMGWNEVILPAEIQEELQRLIKLLENPETTRNLGVRLPKGVLLYGPPGTGKTTIARVIASQSKCSFLTISQSDIYSKWLGESQQNIKKIFQEARNVRPAIIFIDEIDAILASRGSDQVSAITGQVASQILQELDGLQEADNIFVIGSTNAPQALESALLRGGRMSIQIEIPPPGPEERRRLFDLFTSRIEDRANVRWDELVSATEGYTGADIREICDRAILDAYDPDRGFKVVLTHDILKKAAGEYRKHSQVYQVPAYFKRSKVGF